MPDDDDRQPEDEPQEVTCTGGITIPAVGAGDGATDDEE